MVGIATGHVDTGTVAAGALAATVHGVAISTAIVIGAVMAVVATFTSIAVAVITAVGNTPRF